MQKYLSKFKSRYSGKLIIDGDRQIDYKLNAPDKWLALNEAHYLNDKNGVEVHEDELDVYSTYKNENGVLLKGELIRF